MPFGRLLQKIFLAGIKIAGVLIEQFLAGGYMAGLLTGKGRMLDAPLRLGVL
jgi:hypothetical protein